MSGSSHVGRGPCGILLRQNAVRQAAMLPWVGVRRRPLKPIAQARWTSINVLATTATRQPNPSIWLRRIARLRMPLILPRGPWTMKEGLDDDTTLQLWQRLFESLSSVVTKVA